MANLNSVNPIAVIAASVVIVALILVVLRVFRRPKRNQTVGARAADIAAGPVFTARVKQRSGQELEERLPQQQPKLPDHLQHASTDLLVQGTAARLALMLEPFKELQEHRGKLQQLAEDAGKPLLLAVMGLFKSGKSSFINELIGMKDLLRTDDVPATAVVTMLSYGETREVIAHLLDGSTRSYPFEKLHGLSAEGDEEAASFRVSIDYLEVRLPAELLKKVTIVDTPGLNSDNEYHTKATERFADRADQVLWLFSYGQAGSRHEMSRLSQLSGGFKPIGVVNCIDEHDPEEGELDSFLQQVRRRLGNSISRLEAVSTHQASEGRLSADAELMSQSGWHQLEQALQEELYGKSAVKKNVRHLSRLHSLISGLQKDIQERKLKYEQACLLLGDKAKMIQTLSENQKRVQQLLGSFSGLNQEAALHNLESLYPLPGIVSDYQKLNKHMKLLIGVLNELEKEHNNIQKSSRINDQFINDHNIAHRQLENEYEEYNKSGMFGGRPLLDWDGKLKVLNAKAAELERKAEQLNSTRREILSQEKLFLERLERNEQEAYELVQLIIAKLTQSITEFDKLLEDNGEMQDEARRLEGELSWTAAAQSMMSHLMGGELGRFGAVLQQTVLQEGEAKPPAETLEQALSILQELEQQLSGSLNIPLMAEAAPAVLLTEPAAPNCPDLQMLISGAAENAEILLEDACYTLSETLVISKSLRIRGAAHGATVIAGKLEALLRMTAMKELHAENIRFEMLVSAGNIAVIESGQATFEHCIFKDVRAPVTSADSLSQGAALLLRGNSCGILKDCQFKNNTVGAAALETSRLIVHSTLFQHHGFAGIAAADQSTVELYDSELTYNKAGIYADNSTKGNYKNNRLWFNGDGFIAAGEAELTIEDNVIAHSERDGIRGEGRAFVTAIANNCQFNIDGIHLLASAGGYLAANQCSRNLSLGIEYETDSEVLIEYNQCNLNGEGGVAQLKAGVARAAYNKCNENIFIGMYVKGLSGAGQYELEGNTCSNNHISGIALEGSVRVTVGSSTCNNNQYGIFVGEQAQAALNNNQCSHNKYGGIYAGGSSKITASGCECSFSRTGFAISDEAHALITQCTADSNQYNGIGFGRRSTGGVDHSTCSRNGEAGIVVMEQSHAELNANICKDNLIFGIYMYDEAQGIVTENQCSLNEAGICLSGQATPVLKENECFRNEGSGICYMDRAAGTATGNKCHDNVMDGIYITGESTPVLERNVASNNSNSGISVDDKAAPSLHANILQRNAGYGIQLERTVSPKLNANQFQGNKLGEICR